MKEIECSGRKLRGDLLGGWADKEVFSEADTFMNSEGLEGASGAKGWGEVGEPQSPAGRHTKGPPRHREGS